MCCWRKTYFDQPIILCDVESFMATAFSMSRLVGNDADCLFYGFCKRCFQVPRQRLLYNPFGGRQSWSHQMSQKTAHSAPLSWNWVASTQRWSPWVALGVWWQDLAFRSCWMWSLVSTLTWLTWTLPVITCLTSVTSSAFWSYQHKPRQPGEANCAWK